MTIIKCYDSCVAETIVTETAAMTDGHTPVHKKLDQMSTEFPHHKSLALKHLLIETTKAAPIVRPIQMHAECLTNDLHAVSRVCWV